MVRADTRLPGVPNYSYDEPWEPRKRGSLSDPHDRADASQRAPQQGRKWWDYQAPTAAIARPDISLKAVGIPQVSPGAAGSWLLLGRPAGLTQMPEHSWAACALLWLHSR